MKHWHVLIIATLFFILGSPFALFPTVISAAGVGSAIIMMGCLGVFSDSLPQSTFFILLVYGSYWNGNILTRNT